MILDFCKTTTVIGSVPQIIEYYKNLSGGQRFNKALTNALMVDPNILLLDEPTNHLDLLNRKNLIRLLQNYPGTLIMVSHDKELIHHCTDTLWHINNGKVHIFSGNYDDYMQEIKLKGASIQNELTRLNRQKQNIHQKLMKEQKRAAKSKTKGQKSIDTSKWPTVISSAKASKAQETSGRKKSAIEESKTKLLENLAKLHIPEIIIPKFTIETFKSQNKTLVQITNASIGYSKDQIILSDLNLAFYGGERIAIQGNNGSGKSTIIKGIMGDETLYKTGEWYTLKQIEIGYLNQHYNNLSNENTVFQTISNIRPDWPYAKVRQHLNDFLFRKNEEVNALVRTLSGGEKARLSLAQIAAKSPTLLILDEITNNLDLETKDHVIQVLREFPGAMIVISHDLDFFKNININRYIEINNKMMIEFCL